MWCVILTRSRSRVMLMFMNDVAFPLSCAVDSSSPLVAYTPWPTAESVVVVLTFVLVIFGPGHSFWRTDD